MASTRDSKEGHGSIGSPQIMLEELRHAIKAEKNAQTVMNFTQRKYQPSPKHKPPHNWGSKDPITSQTEGQTLLDTGYKAGRQIYNITKNGEIVKFQPTGTADNEYHAYEVTSYPDIPPEVLKKMYEDGKFSKAVYHKYLKGKKNDDGKTNRK